VRSDYASCTAEQVAELFDGQSGQDIWSLVSFAARLEEMVGVAATNFEPTHVAKYAFQLAKQFNLFYHSHHILSEPEIRRQTMLLMVVDMVRGRLEKALPSGIEVPEGCDSMLVVMASGLPTPKSARSHAVEAWASGHPMPGALHRYRITETGAVETAPFADLPGVAECVQVTKPYKLVSRAAPEKTVVRIRNAEIGGGKSRSSEASARLNLANRRWPQPMVGLGLPLLPQSVQASHFAVCIQGLGEEGLNPRRGRERYDLVIVTEAIDEASLELVERYGDVIQIGARTCRTSAC
jgi:hypothetical protein